MQHLLQVSRKVDYALRAMVYLAGKPEGTREPLQDIATKNGIPKEFLAKIVKSLADKGLVSAQRGPHGGVSIGRPATQISFLEVIEAAEGPVMLNLCLDDKHACEIGSSCSMTAVWRAGQERMLDVYRQTKLADLVGPRASAPVPLGWSHARDDDRAPAAS